MSVDGSQSHPHPANEDDSDKQETRRAIIPQPRRAKGRRRNDRDRSETLIQLEIDFRSDPADLVLPCSDQDQARLLGWYVDEVRALNQTYGFYDSIPMICQGSGCFWAELCPTRPDFLFKGLRCPLEIMEIFRRVVRYIRELDIHPDNHVDLSMVADLVRIEIQMRQIDQRIQVEGLLTSEPALVIQGSKEVVYRRSPHPLLADQHRLRRARNEIYNQLLASREARRRIELQEEKKSTNILAVFSQAQNAAKPALQKRREEVVEASYREEETPVNPFPESET